MNKANRNPITNLRRILVTTAIGCSMLTAFGTTADAQSVNDDLKPKEAALKVKTTTKTPIKKTVKPVPKKTVPPQRSKKVVTARLKTPQKIKTVPSFASETPDQILNRFMNFQQSAGVTEQDWKSVLTQTTKMLEANPNDVGAKAQSLIAQGQIAFRQGNYAMAAIHFKSVLQIMPQSSLPHYSLGKTYLANGQAAAAERSFKQAIELNGNFALAYKAMGDALAAQGDQKKATKFFKKATQISVKDGNVPM